jgi:precorrin-6A/cobalt-precorrin-6A reductase
MAAADQVGIPHLRLVRPPWPSRAAWTEVDDMAAAATALGTSGSRRALLALGRQELDPFRHLAGLELIVRSVNMPPEGPWTAIVARGPFSYDAELTLLRTKSIDTVVTRNSGGPSAKLDAAETVGASVVMIRRPHQHFDGPTVGDVDSALAWVLSLG